MFWLLFIKNFLVARDLFIILSQEKLSGVPLLVFANKQDLLSSLGPAELSAGLNLHAIRDRYYDRQIVMIDYFIFQLLLHSWRPCGEYMKLKTLDIHIYYLALLMIHNTSHSYCYVGSGRSSAALQRVERGCRCVHTDFLLYRLIYIYIYICIYI